MSCESGASNAALSDIIRQEQESFTAYGCGGTGYCKWLIMTAVSKNCLEIKSGSSMRGVINKALSLLEKTGGVHFFCSDIRGLDKVVSVAEIVKRKFRLPLEQHCCFSPFDTKKDNRRLAVSLHIRLHVGGNASLRLKS